MCKERQQDIRPSQLLNNSVSQFHTKRKSEPLGFSNAILKAKNFDLKLL